MNAVVNHLKGRYLALSARERGLALAAALVLIGGLGELLLIDPPLHRRSQLLQQIVSQQSERDALAQQLGSARRDPNAALRQQLADLQTQLRETDGEFEKLQNGLVQPRHMGELLKSLLAEHSGLQLLGLRTLPVTPYSDSPADPAKKPLSGAAAAASSAAGTADDAWLYRHAVEIRVQGSYADMTAYLQALEGLPRRVHWGDLEIDAHDYPSNVMTVTIFTVSMEKSWWTL